MFQGDIELTKWPRQSRSSIVAEETTIKIDLDAAACSVDTGYPLHRPCRTGKQEISGYLFTLKHDTQLSVCPSRPLIAEAASPDAGILVRKELGNFVHRVGDCIVEDAIR
jgi:hypothetical protein